MYLQKTQDVLYNFIPLFVGVVNDNGVVRENQEINESPVLIKAMSKTRLVFIYFIYYLFKTFFIVDLHIVKNQFTSTN